MPKLELTAERVRELLDYDPETGVFRWKDSRSQAVEVGSVAGSLDKHTGYIRIGVARNYVAAHRLAWLWVHGRWPDGELDHKNRVRSDNRLENLREATRSQNTVNATVRNATGYRGVKRHKGSYVARIKANGKQVELGYFRSAEAAHARYVQAAIALHGEFARAD